MKIQRGIVKVCNIKCILNCKFWGPAGPPDFVIALKMYQNPPLHIVYVFVSDTKGRRKKNWEKAVRLNALGGEGGSPPSSLTASICENFDPFYTYIFPL